MFYAVQATTTEQTEHGEITRQVPTFYLDSNVQGIVSEQHAMLIVKSIVSAFGGTRQVSFSVTALED